MKECKKCGDKLPFTEFYKHKQMSDGHLNICKSCVKARVNQYRSDNIEKVREYDRKRGQLPERKERVRDYAKTDRGRKVNSRAKLNYIQRNRKIRSVHVITGNAIRDGKLVKQAYESCGTNSNIHAHHDDYNKPLIVRWLCAACHSDWHKHNQPLNAS